MVSPDVNTSVGNDVVFSSLSHRGRLCETLLTWGLKHDPNRWSANPNERLDKQKSNASNPIIPQSVQFVLLYRNIYSVQLQKNLHSGGQNA